MHLVEVLEMPNQPFSGEDRGNRNRQRIFPSALGGGDRGRKRGHGAGQMWLHCKHMSGWQQQTVLPLEQLHAKLGLGLVNLLADGADGYAEFVRCRLDRAQPSDGFHRREGRRGECD